MRPIVYFCGPLPPASAAAAPTAIATSAPTRARRGRRQVEEGGHHVRRTTRGEKDHTTPLRAARPHDVERRRALRTRAVRPLRPPRLRRARRHRPHAARRRPRHRDRKSTRLNSSHQIISYAVFCLKKKKNTQIKANNQTNNHT